MGYLLAKIVLLLALAVVCGFLLARWWLRRSYVEVTEEYSRLLEGSAAAQEVQRGFGARLQALEKSIGALRLPDLGPITRKLERLENAAASYQSPDLGPIESRLDALSVLGERLAALEDSIAQVRPEAPDLEPLTARLEGLERAVASFRSPDLGPIESRLDAFASFGERLGSLETSVTQAAPSTPDLGPLAARIEGLEQAVASVRYPDLGPIESRLDAFASFGERLESLARSVAQAAPSPPDLGPLLARLDEIQAGLATMGNAEVHHRLDSIEQALAALGSIDLAPVHRRLEEIDQAVGARPPSGSIDLSPVLDRLTALESRLDAGTGSDDALSSHIDGLYRQVDALRPLLERASARPSAAADGEPSAFRMEDRNLLRRAAFGAPDDLKRIKGVGPALERLLHRTGVYYFWQIADWTKDDVAFMDGKLEIFQGRISWDRWVDQAQKLVEESASARPPESLEARG